MSANQLSFRPWTPAEDAVIRDRYVTAGSAAVARDLGRTVSSVCHRARRLRVLSRRRWTPADDNRLRNLWGSHPVAHVAKMLGRTEATTYWRAQKLGLPLGCPQGMEYLTHAAERTGYQTSQLTRILRWAGVPEYRSASRKTGAARHFHVVDPFDVDEAIAAWLKTETAEFAAKSRGLVTETMVRILEQFGEGVPPRPKKRKAHWRIPTEVIDAAIAKRDQYETLSEAARRNGIAVWRMWRRAKAAGVERPPGTKLWLIRREDADRLAAEMGARKERAA